MKTGCEEGELNSLRAAATGIDVTDSAENDTEQAFSGGPSGDQWATRVARAEQDRTTACGRAESEGL